MELPAEQPKKAAVIILKELATDSLILTLRSSKLRHHPGEACFPGGHWQEDDLNFYQTALRELNEELQIKPERVSLIRPLVVERTLAGSLIYPWFASIEQLEPFQIDAEEVREVFSLPMKAVTNPINYQEVELMRYGLKIKSQQFVASPHFIWGATVRIMKQLVKQD